MTYLVFQLDVNDAKLFAGLVVCKLIHDYDPTDPDEEIPARAKYELDIYHLLQEKKTKIVTEASGAAATGSDPAGHAKMAFKAWKDAL